MSIITKIEVQKKDESRVNLYLDDKFYAGISIEVIMKNHLKKDLEISKEKLDEIILEDEKQKAINKAIKYIGSSLKTSKQIKDYLYKKEFNPNTTKYVIEKLIEYKYLDDYNFAKSFVLTYSSKYGRLKLISALKSKGISQDIIDDVLQEENVIKDSIDIVAEKYLRNKEITKETLVKLNRFLCSRGYDFDQISTCINKLKRD